MRKRLAALLVSAVMVQGVVARAESLRPEPGWHPLVSDDILSDGEHQRLLTLSPDHPRGAVVMLPGGSGRIGIQREGTILRADNVVIRTAPLWLARGYAVVIPDAPDGRNMRGSRSQPVGAEAVDDLVGKAHETVTGPVFLIGTSQGAIAAMSGAAALPGGQIAGLVLLEAVSRLGGSHETVFDAHPERVTTPVLIVANTDDTCRVSPPEDALKIKTALTIAARVDVMRLPGGEVGGRDVARVRRMAWPDWTTKQSEWAQIEWRTDSLRPQFHAPSATPAVRTPIRHAIAFALAKDRCLRARHLAPDGRRPYVAPIEVFR